MSPARPVAEVVLDQLGRAPVIRPFQAYADSTSIGATSTAPVVSFRMPDGMIGYLTALGHETTHLGWDNLAWAIRVGAGSVPGFGEQTGQQWGRISNPGEVFAHISGSSVVSLVAKNPSAAAILASGYLRGYFWPRVEPGAELR